MSLTGAKSAPEAEDWSVESQGLLWGMEMSIFKCFKSCASIFSMKLLKSGISG